MPNLALQPGTPPVDSALPDTPQALLNFVAAYLGVSGLENLAGVIVSVDAPPAPPDLPPPAAIPPLAADRDKLWVKKDPSSNRAIGFYLYHGGWNQIPFIVPSGPEEPAHPALGELFFNTAREVLRIYDGTAWTSNLFHSGDSTSRPGGDTGNAGSRPTDVALNYLFFDTEIGRMLRMTSQGWSTLDGAVGDVKMMADTNKATAEKLNPGWSVFTDMAGRFPLGVDEFTDGSTTTGGVSLEQMKLKWSAKGLSAQGGAREANTSFITSLTLNTKTLSAYGKSMSSPTDIDTEQSSDLTPPYRSLLFLIKRF